MFFMIILILTFLSLSTTEASEYYRYKEHATWTEALSSCALALPMFREHLDQTVVGISNKVTDDLWVGYFKALTAFEYKGCIRNENFTKKFGSARLTIGLCFSACGRKQIVGISGRKCYCEDQMNFDADVRFTYCYKSRNPIASVHNTCDQNDCVSVYKVNNRVTKDQTLDMKDEMCLKFESVQYRGYAWTDCGQHNLAFCAFEEAHLTLRKPVSWRESANWCFAHEGNPLTDAELRLKTDSLSNSAWTSIICSYVIYTYTEYDNRLNSIRYGYLASEGPRTVLKFIDASTEKKMILCRNGSPETSTIVSTQTGHVSTDNASGRYFKLNKTWFEASKECDMVMPNVTITSNKFVMDIQEQINRDENGLWVGYFMMKTGFEYMGCFKKPRMTAKASSLLNTPGLCYTACNKASIIGISGYECFCLNGKLPRSNDTCNWSCRSHDWISCGGNDLLSVYRSNNEVTGKEPSAKEENDNCLSFEYTDGENKIFTWKACSKYKRQLCYTTDRLINGINDDPWNMSVQHCLRPPSRPSYYKDLQDTTVQINPSWSGIIRSDVMYEYKDFKDSYANVWYGYVTTDSKTSQPILRFTKDGNDKRRAALCQNKGFAENANDDQSSSKGVTVGVSVAVVLIAIAVASTIVVLKRRQIIPSLCRGIAKTKESGYTDSNNVTARNPNVKTAFDNFGYSVAPKNSNASDEHQTINHTHTYFEHDQPETASNTNEEKENDYNEITLDINATYDHADNKTKNGEQNTEHTYDTTKMPAIKRKEFADNNPDNFGDTGEDAYNHINGQPLKSSKTDNVYGVPKQQENYSKGAGKSFDEDIRDTEDTYNHINEKPLKSDGTDNVYGLSSN